MNLINLREAPIVDKAREGATLFALNTDGTVERISTDNVGGKVAIIKVNMSGTGANTVPLMTRLAGESMTADTGVETPEAGVESLEAGMETLEAGVESLEAGVEAVDAVAEPRGSAAEYTCTCDNMTFEEARAILLAGGKLDAVITAEVDGYVASGYAIGAAYTPMEDTQPEMIELFSRPLGDGADVTTVWTADGIVVELG